ncbi:hypothetical protein JP0092_06960 [Helicobacter pylori]|nr:hypothetical protein JP0092_06960 [Helicobacter pylori]
MLFKAFFTQNFFTQTQKEFDAESSDNFLKRSYDYPYWFNICLETLQKTFFFEITKHPISAKILSIHAIINEAL